MICQIFPKFVDEIPEEINEGYLYLCLQYNAVIHKCACGCGEIISTPLDKKYGWVIQYDGELVTLSPSVGNGSYKCCSHYFIQENRIVWLPKMRKSVMQLEEKEFSKIKKFLRKWRKNK